MTPGSSTFLVRLQRHDPRVFNFFSKIAKFCLCRGRKLCTPDQELGALTKDLASSLRFSEFWQASSPTLYFLHASSFPSSFLKKCYQKKVKKYEVLTLLLGVKNVCPLIFFCVAYQLFRSQPQIQRFLHHILLYFWEKNVKGHITVYCVFLPTPTSHTKKLLKLI
jgi:hypothetical protein